MKDTTKDISFDIYGLEKRFANLEQRIQEGIKNKYGKVISDLLPENKPILLRWVRKQQVRGKIKKHRLLKYETWARNYDRLLKKPFDQATREDIEGVVITVRNSPTWGDTTKRDFLQQLKTFYKLLLDYDKEYPEIVKNIEVEDKKKEPIDLSQIPSYGDVLAMCKHVNCRDRAFLLLHFELGSRIGESLTLKVRDFVAVENGAYVHIRRSKTDLRKVFVKLCVPDVVEWLDNHPLKHSPDFKEQPIFVKFEKQEKTILTQRYYYNLLNRVSKKAGINKKVTAHLIRHGSASDSASYLSHAEMCYKHGWKFNSDAPEVYLHPNPESIMQKVLKKTGDLKDDEKTSIYDVAPKKIECFWCKKMCEPDRIKCWNCGRVLDITQAQTAQKMAEKLEIVGAEVLKNPQVLTEFFKRLAEDADKQAKRC